MKECPTIYRYVQTTLNTLISDTKGSCANTQAWMEALPNVMYTFRGELTAEGEIHEYTWGMAMTDEMLEKDAFIEMTHRAHELGYRDKGYIWGRLILTARHEDSRNSYIELVLPIE